MVKRHEVISFLREKIITHPRRHNPIQTNLNAVTVDFDAALDSFMRSLGDRERGENVRVHLGNAPTRRARLDDAIYTVGVLQDIYRAVNQLFSFTPAVTADVQRYSTDAPTPGPPAQVQQLGDLLEQVRTSSSISQSERTSIVTLRKDIFDDLWDEKLPLRRALADYNIPLRDRLEDTLEWADFALRRYRYAGVWASELARLDQVDPKWHVLIDRDLLKEMLRNVFFNVRHNFHRLRGRQGKPHADLVKLSVQADDESIRHDAGQPRYVTIKVESRGVPLRGSVKPNLHIWSPPHVSRELWGAIDDRIIAGRWRGDCDVATYLELTTCYRAHREHKWRSVEMNGLAWDDEPEYFERLLPHLEDFGISLDITDDHDDFIRRYRNGEWDFVITDLMEERVKGEIDPKGGVDIAKKVCADGLPLFVITGEYEKVDRTALEIPDSAILKSKLLHPGWVAQDIYDELVRRGDYVNHQKVFLIHGHDGRSDGTTERVEKFLEDRGLEVVRLAEKPTTEIILPSLIQDMSECAAAIAICTPDDQWDDNTRHPRQKRGLGNGTCPGPVARAEAFDYLAERRGENGGQGRVAIRLRWRQDVAVRQQDSFDQTRALLGCIGVQIECARSSVGFTCQLRVRTAKIQQRVAVARVAGDDLADEQVVITAGKNFDQFAIHPAQRIG